MIYCELNMKPLVKKIKPVKGYAHLAHVLLNVALPVLAFVFVRSSFAWLAIALVLLSKWRMFAVRPRFWGANIRANAIDIVVGLSMVAFMIQTNNDWARLGYAVAWAVWLVVLKPRSSVLFVSIQALVGYAAGLMAIFSVWGQSALICLVLAVGFLSYFVAHHFLYSFDEPHKGLLAYVWAYFGSALTWILGHWLVFYLVIAQPTIILASLGLVISTLYYLDHFDRLSTLVRRQIIFVGFALVVIMWGSLVFFHWLRSGSIIV